MYPEGGSRLFISTEAPFYKSNFRQVSVTDFSDALESKQRMFEVTKLLVLGQASSTTKRYKRYLKNSFFMKTRIFSLNYDRFFLIKLNTFLILEELLPANT